NLTYGRELPKGFAFEASYVGRAARNLLAVRDIMALNNLVDTKSGADWYTAAGRFANRRESNTPSSSWQSIPYFVDLFPGLVGKSRVNGQTVRLTATQAFYRRVARACVDNKTNNSGQCAIGAIGGRNTTDWTFVQDIFNDSAIVPNAFYHPQYAAL